MVLSSDSVSLLGEALLSLELGDKLSVLSLLVLLWLCSSW